MGNEWEDRLKDNEIRSFIIRLMNDLKSEIVSEVKQALNKSQMPNLKKWVKSAEVKKLLNVSHGKLQTMRNAKTISFTKIGGTLYYNIDDIQRMLEENCS